VTLLQRLKVSYGYAVTCWAGSSAERRCPARFLSRKYEAASSLLRDLHWLRVLQRIEFKLAVLTSAGRPQLWGSRARAPPPRLPTISLLVHFGVNLTANYPNIV